MKVEKKKKVEEIKKPIIEAKEEKEIPNGFHELTDLPSKLKLYPKGTKIYARPLRMIEIKQLTNINETNYNFVIDNVLKSTTILDGVEYSDILTADKLYIVFWERANTYQGDGFSVEFNCENCMELAIEKAEKEGTELTRKDMVEIARSKYDFTVANLQLTDIKDDYDPNYEIELPISGDKVTVFQHTVGIERATNKALLEKIIPNADEELLMIASVLSSVNGQPMDLKSAYIYLTEECHPADFIAIEKYKSKYDINISPVLKVDCKKCGGAVEAPLTFQPGFFLPAN